MSYQVTEPSFLKDVSKHAVAILRDDGVNRHVRFKKPDSSTMYFDLITWPGHLCYTGDMGTFVFARITDMFDFFRAEPETCGDLHINTGYWSEKVLAADRDGITKFSEGKFRSAIEDYLAGHNASQDLRDEVESEVLAMLDDGEYAAMQAVMNFKFEGFQFQDFFEADCTEYTTRFVWCCYALAWGIRQYDDAKKLAKEAA